MKTIFLFSILISLNGFLFASGSGAIKGNLLDEFGRPVPMANTFIKVGAHLVGAQSDMDGKFLIKPIPSGTYDLYVTSIGFDTLFVKGVRVISDRITFLKNKVLKVRVIGGAICSTERWETPLIQIDEPSVSIIDDSDLESLPSRTSLLDAISTLTPGIYKTEGSDQVMIRGSRAGASTYFIDGVKSTSLNNAIPSSAVGSIKVYAGGIPAQYGDVVGGVIAVETKSYLGWYKKK